MLNKKTIFQKILVCAFISVGNYNTFASDIASAENRGVHEEVFVIGNAESLRTLTGSATFVDSEAIARFETTDLNALLTRVPGVYIRQEDGFGLRPNINLRGTSSDRSSKITIMEDSMLIGPAPYSAPAAYYIPNVTRMEAVEVFKGPSAIKYGPHTVGGAINFATRNIPENSEGKLSAAAGSYGYQKLRAFYGNNFENFGYWVDALSYGSDGFKELDGGGDTGFIRNDVNAKLLWRFGGDIYQELVLKLGYADEDADETYLGLTDADFAEDPTRRYPASQLDNFTSDHQQIHIIHTADFNDRWKLTTRAYHNRFDRAWNKFDGIIAGELVNDVLARPDFFVQEIELLRGERNSNPLSSQRIDVTNNDRSFEVSGIQFELDYEQLIGEWLHELELGLRLHNDVVERDHSQRGYFMQDGVLIFDGDENRPNKALNRGETDAIAIFLNDQFSRGPWKINLGLRVESIESEFGESAPGIEREQSDSQEVFTPGAGVFFEINEHLGILAGVNKGFSAKAASADTRVDPEESTNYELGARYNKDETALEAIVFFSDYTNLLGRCRASDPCAGEEFNGGEVEVFGLELNAAHQWIFSNGLNVLASVVYTYTDASFATSFESNFAQWGDIVEEGFELPYLPKNQGRAQLGLEYKKFSANVALQYVDKMREVAGAGEFEQGLFTEALTTLDFALTYQVNDAWKIKFIGENITDEQEIVSRRPFGARPNQPQTFKLGATYSF